MLVVVRRGRDGGGRGNSGTSGAWCGGQNIQVIRREPEGGREGGRERGKEGGREGERGGCVSAWADMVVGEEGGGEGGGGGGPPPPHGFPPAKKATK